MEQQIKGKKEELPNKDRIGHNKNILARMDETDNKSDTDILDVKGRKGVFGRLREEESESTFDSSDEQLMFNGKPVIKGSENIILFCEKLEQGDLYIKHYHEGNAYFSQWVIHGEAGEKGTLKVKSTNSLDVSNKLRDSELKNLAKAEYGICRRTSN